MKRQDIIQAICNKPDIRVLIIGDGINGVALYRELALQGVAASTASSHMIHGGLRYMENGEFRLVKEALVERNRLRKNAPHFVQPLACIIVPILGWSDAERQGEIDRTIQLLKRHYGMRLRTEELEWN